MTHLMSARASARRRRSPGADMVRAAQAYFYRRTVPHAAARAAATSIMRPNSAHADAGPVGSLLIAPVLRCFGAPRQSPGAHYSILEKDVKLVRLCGPQHI